MLGVLFDIAYPIVSIADSLSQQCGVLSQRLRRIGPVNAWGRVIRTVIALMALCFNRIFYFLIDYQLSLFQNIAVYLDFGSYVFR